MAYTSAAVYEAAVAIDGGFEPYGPPITAQPGASLDCAVVEASYRTLRYYFASFPTLVANLDAYYAEALSNFGGASPMAARARLSASQPRGTSSACAWVTGG
jgi:hypothetical protein